MPDEPSGLEQRLKAHGGVLKKLPNQWDTGALLREAALRLGELRRALTGVLNEFGVDSGDGITNAQSVFDGWEAIRKLNGSQHGDE